MSKTLYSVLPLIVLLGPSYARLYSFFGLSLLPSTARVEPDYLRRPDANPVVAALRARVRKARGVLEQFPADTKETLDTVTLAVGDAEGRVQTLKVSKEE